MKRAALLLMAGAVAVGCGMLKKKAMDTAESAVSSPESAVETAEGVKGVAEKIEDLTEDLTPENEYYVGRSVATNILARHDYEYADKDAIAAGELEGLTLYVNEVGYLISVAAMETARDGDRPSPIAGFHFTVVESDQVNAFAAPGGYVFVTTAALRLARTEDELAAILAHEVAHVVRGHALGTIKKSRYANISKDALQATGALSGEQLGQLTELLEGAIDDMIDAFFVKGYSKETEYEADAVGFEIMKASGYDPAALVAYLDRLARNQDTGEGGFYQTHPKASDRIAKLVERGAAKKAKVVGAREKRFAKATRGLGKGAGKGKGKGKGK